MNEELLLWHVTSRQCVAEILRAGLKAQLGPRAQAAGEVKPCVYCFTKGTAVENALMGWLDEVFENSALALLELRVPRGRANISRELLWEATIDRDVPAQCIRVLVPQLERWCGRYPQLPVPAAWRD